MLLGVDNGLAVMSGKDIEFTSYTLGDINVIELLLSYRYKYDDNMFIDDSVTPMAVSGAHRINEEVIVTYATLDRYIRDCNFNRTQREILRMVGEGYTQEEIAFELDIPRPRIRSRLRTIYREIKRENDRRWRNQLYTELYGLKTKECSRCQEEWPVTLEFYSVLEHSRDGFHSQCRKCKT